LFWWLKYLDDLEMLKTKMGFIPFRWSLHYLHINKHQLNISAYIPTTIHIISMKSSVGGKY
jgi:hypothetical protein